MKNTALALGVAAILSTAILEASVRSSVVEHCQAYHQNDGTCPKRIRSRFYNGYYTKR